MSNKLEFKIIDIYTFVQNHTHVYYCEAIILPDGKITYAIPSHQICLQNLTGLSNNKLYEMSLDLSYEYLEILLNFTKCVSVWYEFYIIPTKHDITQNQKESLKLLQTSGCCNFKCNQIK